MRRAFLALLSVFVGSAAPADEPSSHAAFRAALTRLHAEAGFPGAVAAFARADEPIHVVAVGLSDVESAKPMREDHRMLSGSTGKSFTAAVALSLAQEGRLDLDAPISRWLGDAPWFADLPGGSAITPRMLLRHQSGLRDHVHDPAFQARVARALPTNPDVALPPADLIGFVLDDAPLFAPGTGYAYTDTGYIIAGLVIEAVTGEPYFATLKRRFLEPLGLELTMPADRRDLPGLASGYISGQGMFDLPPKVTEDGTLVYNPASEWTGGGLATNAGDLARWAIALYEGQAMQGPYLDTLLDAVPKDASQRRLHGEDVAYGLGVTLRTTDLGPAQGHRGWTPGYLSVFEYYPDHRLAVALQINELGEHDMSAYAETLAESVIWADS